MPCSLPAASSRVLTSASTSAARSSSLPFCVINCSVINATIETVNGTWLRIWPSMIRLQYFTAGIFYVPQEMPDWLRDVLVLNPLLQCIEWFRTAFFDQDAPPWLDRALEYIRELGPRRTYLTHMAHDVKHSRDCARLPPGIEFAYDGLEINDEF